VHAIRDICCNQQNWQHCNTSIHSLQYQHVMRSHSKSNSVKFRSACRECWVLLGYISSAQGLQASVFVLQGRVTFISRYFKTVDSDVEHKFIIISVTIPNSKTIRSLIPLSYVTVIGETVNWCTHNSGNNAAVVGRQAASTAVGLVGLHTALLWTARSVFVP
jgi:hypothetical protein